MSSLKNLVVGRYTMDQGLYGYTSSFCMFLLGIIVPQLGIFIDLPGCNTYFDIPLTNGTIRSDESLAALVTG